VGAAKHFFSGNPNFYLLPAQLESQPQQQRQAPTKSDKKAQRAFQQLLKIALPKVESPEVGEDCGAGNSSKYTHTSTTILNSRRFISLEQ
jgi:hypothetical protein